MKNDIMIYIKWNEKNNQKTNMNKPNNVDDYVSKFPGEHTKSFSKSVR